MPKRYEPKDIKPWERLPEPERGDPDMQQTFAAVGEALTEWNEFEHHLANLFCDLIGLGILAMASSRSAARAFGSVRTFEGRLEMIQAASEVYATVSKFPVLQTLTKPTATKWRGFAERRNEIAHGTVQKFVTGSSTQWEPTLGFCVMPFWYEFRKYRLDTKHVYFYGSTELRYFANQFKQLQDSVLILRRYMALGPEHT